LCRHIGLLLGKRLDTILLRHRIRKYPDSASTRYRIRCGFIFSTLESRFKNIRIGCRIRRMRVDGSRIRKEKVADSKIPIPYSQFLRLRRLCSDDDDFLVKSRDMTTFFTQRGYPCTSLEHDLRRVTSIRRPNALSGSERGERTVDRVPVVLTYHPFNTQIKRYLIQNFRILSTDLQTRDIFPRAPFVAYKRDLNIRNMLVRSTNNSSTEQPGSCACQRSRWNTCEYINPLTVIPGPKCTFTIREHFTCMSENLVYCISCRRCSHLYIGETSRSLRSRFGEHLRSIRKNTPGFPVAQHFNSTCHSITDVQVRGMRLCNGTNIQRKQQEMRLIFRLGTVQPHGLNINFSYI